MPWVSASNSSSVSRLSARKTPLTSILSSAASPSVTRVVPWVLICATTSASGVPENCNCGTRHARRAFNVTAGRGETTGEGVAESRATDAAFPASTTTGGATAGSAGDKDGPAGAECRTATRPSVTSTSTEVRPSSTEKAVPTARTSTPPTLTTNGRAGSFSTWKCASPSNTSTFLSAGVKADATRAPARNSTTEPSGKRWRSGRCTVTAVDEGRCASGAPDRRAGQRNAPSNTQVPPIAAARTRRRRRFRNWRSIARATSDAAPAASIHSSGSMRSAGLTGPAAAFAEALGGTFFTRD